MNKTLIVTLLCCCALTACSKSTRNVELNTATTETQVASSAEISSAHNAQNSLDWAGDYQGTLPCADCEGIKTQLILNADSTYSMTETYLGKGNDNPFKSTGNFSFGHTGSIITLDQHGDQRKYFVAENQLYALDQEGKKIEGNLSEHYILKKAIN
jgi:uncharacterized lipoprotein NlpE involved in copper resistance